MTPTLIDAQPRRRIYHEPQPLKPVTPILRSKPAAQPTEQAFQKRVEDLGTEILERARAAQPRIWQEAWWQQFMMNLSMRHEALKVQAFRFVDVLPAIFDNDESIARHLREYLDPRALPMPAALKLMLGYKHNDALHARLVAGAARLGATMMAERFIAGSNAPEAIRFVERLRRKKMAFTLDVLGEYTSSSAQADRYQQTYLDLIESLCPAARDWPDVPMIDRTAHGPQPRVNISIKLTALSPHFDAIDPKRGIESVADRLRPILRAARKHGAFINVDMESYGYRAITFELFKRVLSEREFRDWPDIGIVVQAYLREADEDFEALLDWVQKRGTPIAVRLVKGAYWDVETAMASQNNVQAPVWLKKWESDACFERITKRMLQSHRWIRPAFASHNIRSLAVAMAEAERLDLSPGDYEIQTLHGMGDPLKNAIVGMNRCLRVYTPYGELIAGMGYLIRRLLENTANDSFLRQTFSTREAGRLLADPAVARPPSDSPRRARYTDIDEEDPMPSFQNETVLSFSNPANRDRFAAALDYVRGELGKEYPLFINGEPARTGKWIESYNPSKPSEIVGKAASATTADADRAVAAAAKALPPWRATPMAQRAEVLRQTADAIRKRRFEFAAWITLEAGKPWREADADVAEALDYLDYYAACAARLAEKPRRRDLPGEDNYLVYEPKGVCVVLAPWSFPLALLTNMTAAALVTGNTVVMKPASATPVIAAKLTDAFVSVGLPRGVLNYLPGDGATLGRHLVSHPDVNVISITGSREVGADVLRLAGDTPLAQKHIKKVIAELGGKNAIIVDDDADLDEAVGGVITSAYGFSGQKCTSCSRVIVLAGVYDAFCQKLVDAASELCIGPADEPGTFMGPVIDEASRERLLAAITASRDQGRMILSDDGNGLPRDGYFVGPTIIADVDPLAPLAQEELLGPILAVIKADSFDSALAIANNTRYALTGGLYSRSPAHIDQGKREFLVGNLYINRKITGSRVDIEPFGGLKMSGDGAKAGGPDYLHHYCNARTITEHTLRHGLAPAQEVQTKA